MAEIIPCRDCQSPDCKGCNVLELSKALARGHFAGLMDENNCLHIDSDLAPVVRCKDCDCWNTWDSAGRKSLGNFVCSCAHWSVEDGPVLYTKPDEFCSYGEKIEEEDHE